MKVARRHVPVAAAMDVTKAEKDLAEVCVRDETPLLSTAYEAVDACCLVIVIGRLRGAGLMPSEMAIELGRKSFFAAWQESAEEAFDRLDEVRPYGFQAADERSDFTARRNVCRRVERKKKRSSHDSGDRRFQASTADLKAAR